MSSEQEPGLGETKVKQQGQFMDNGGKGKMQCATVEYCTVGPCAEAGCFFREQKREGSRPINHQPGWYCSAAKKQTAKYPSLQWLVSKEAGDGHGQEGIGSGVWYLQPYPQPCQEGVQAGCGQRQVRQEGGGRGAWYLQLYPEPRQDTV